MRNNPLNGNRWLYLIVALFCFVLYGNTVFNDYSLDDHLVTTAKHKQISRGISAIPEIFTTNYVDWRNIKVDYRPLVKATYALEFEVFGENPGVSHFINVLLYALSCMLLLGLLFRIFPSERRWILFTALLLYAAHPVHTEVVASIKSRDEILSFLFVLLAFHSALNWSDKKGWIHLLLLAVALYLSFISKASCMPWIGLIGFVLLFMRKEKWTKVVGISAVMLAVVTLHFMVMSVLLDSVLRTHIFIETPFFLLDNPAQKWPSIISGAGHYLKLLVAPTPLCSFYGYNQVPVTSWSNYSVYLSLAGFGGLIFLGVKGLFKPTVITVGAIILLLDIFPFINIIYPYTGIVGERVLYGGSIGFTLILVGGLAHFFNNKSKGIFNGFFPDAKPMLVFLAVILLAFSSRTIHRNFDWKDQLTLFAADAKNCDQSAKLHELYAQYIRGKYVNENIEDWHPMAMQAISEYHACIDIYAQWPIPYHRLGVIYHYDLELPDSALSYYQKAVNLNPRFNIAMYDLARCLQDLGRFSQAAVYFSKLVELDLSDFDSWNRMVTSHFMAAEFAKADVANRAFIKRFPNRYEPYIHQGNIVMAQGDTASAFLFFDRALSLNPSNISFQEYLRSLAISYGDLEKTERYTKR